MSHVATVTIDNTEVDADLTDFPVYIDLSDMPASFWDVVTNGGGDIRVFKDDDSTELAREVVSCLTASDTGELHVKFTGTLSSSTDTDIHIYADGTSTEPAVTATYGRDNVWSAYEAVWHFQDTNWIDSSGNLTALTASTTAPSIVTGKIGNGASFNKSTPNYLSHSGVTFSGSRSWQCWAKHDVLNDDRIMMAQGNAGGLPRAGSTGARTGVYKLFHGTFDGTDVTAYQNGADATTNRVSGVSSYGYGMRDKVSLGIVMDINPSTSSTLSFGTRPSNLGTLNFDGILSESRLRDDELSATWISTEYNNQNSPSTFYTVTAVSSSTTSIKSLNGLAIASVKSRNGLAKASIKSINGLSNTS